MIPDSIWFAGFFTLLAIGTFMCLAAIERR